jgi:hypothetical protein
MSFIFFQGTGIHNDVNAVFHCRNVCSKTDRMRRNGACNFPCEGESIRRGSIRKLRSTRYFL